MCGIIGYTGHRPAVPVLLEGLRRLEYRGYDSSGVAFIEGSQMHIIRTEGKLAALEERVRASSNNIATAGIGHTRWATHGIPVERNAHPHQDNQGRLALVHNGIIENYQEQKTWLLEQGYSFISETDTEVLVNLIACCLKETDSLPAALSRALQGVKGAYAIAVVDKEEPGAVYAVRQSCPLVLGTGIGEQFIASDIPAFLHYTREVTFPEDGEMVRIDATSSKVLNVRSLVVVPRQSSHIDWDIQSAQKGGYKHFMLKEIVEQPRVITDCLAGRIAQDHPDIPLEVCLPELEDMPVPPRLSVVACGTSYHAGLWGMQLMESWAGIPTRVEIASEFRYRDIVLGKGDVVIAISQSGETADTLAAMDRAREAGATVIGLCNVVGSSVARRADRVLFTQAGPEISVASTKALCSQLVVLLLLAYYWGNKKKCLDEDTARHVPAELSRLPALLEKELPDMRLRAQELVRKYAAARSFMYLGRGLSFPMALEGALKLKELSYIHAEGSAAGEMKHGPIALIDNEFPTFALVPADKLHHKVKSNLEEIQARGGKIIALTEPGTDLSTCADDVWCVPAVRTVLHAFICLPCLQFFAYEMADYLGKDVDQPRNLAKSVTVE